MPEYSPQALCNVAFVGSPFGGKSTLIDAVLAAADAPPAQASPSCDFDPIEQKHGHSLQSCVVHLDYGSRHINLIDTPGAADFRGMALSVFPAVETVALVIDPQRGIDQSARDLMSIARERRLCRAVVVNKIDSEEVSLTDILDDIGREFGPQCLPLTLPVDDGARVVDCFFATDRSPHQAVRAAHTHIVDQVVELDEALMAQYLEQGQELTSAQLHAPFEQAMREGHLVPVCFVSAKTGAGIPEFLRVLTDLMPSPLEGNPRPFLSGFGAEAEPFDVVPDPERHVVAHVFKVTSDPYIGKLSVFRVHQGTVRRDSQLFVGDNRRAFRVGHLFKLIGARQIEIDEAIPGDICALGKVDIIERDAVLHDSHDEDRLHLQAFPFPEPVFALAIEAKRRGDEQKVNELLARIADEDPSLRLEHRVATNETVLRGLGELHVRVALERLSAVFNVEVETHPPSIPYRETITERGEAHYRHKKQTGGAGQFGEVSLSIEPLPRGSGFEFVNRITGGVIPGVFIPAVEKGVQQAMGTGAIAGYPMQDIRVILSDGKYHSVDSKEIAFVTAGRRAFLEAVKHAQPVVLEPFVTLEVTVAQSAMGAVNGDLASKRGQIEGTEMASDDRVTIRAAVPMQALQTYEAELRSLTGGHGEFAMTFSHYAPVPESLQATLTADYVPEGGED